MSKVLSIEELRAKATQEIAIPGFADSETIFVRVRKPRIVVMMAQGKIPNPLLGTVQELMKGKSNTKNMDMSDMAKVHELYCRSCMVKPTYEEMADIITDEQMLAVFNWAVGGIAKVEPFRENEKDGPDNYDGQGVPEETE